MTTDTDTFDRLRALKNEFGALTPAQRDFVNGKLSQEPLLFADEPVTRRELREQERRLATFESRLSNSEGKAADLKYKVETQGIDLTAQARGIDALAARVRRLESRDIPIAEIAVVGLAGVLFVSLIVAVANAAADPI